MDTRHALFIDKTEPWHAYLKGIEIYNVLLAGTNSLNKWTFSFMFKEAWFFFPISTALRILNNHTVVNLPLQFQRSE